MANLTYPLMRSLPQVVFTAAFLKYPTPAVVCSRVLSAALELCSSVLPSNLVKRELDYSIALSLDFLILDESLYLHHKDPSKLLYIEVDASDVGWGACAYQMTNPFEGDPKDEARMRVGDTGPRSIIQWVSKAWTDHELKLPVFIGKP